jgi:20S proteasome subunit alpha 5
MFSNRNEYDRNVRCFSPEGRLYQVEYAIEAIKLGTTAVGITTAEGVVLAVEKRLSSSLIEARSVQKILEIDSHCGAALSGLAADARMLIEHARVEAQNHRFTYDDAMGIEPLTQTVCDLALSFAESSEEAEKKTSRPFGVALLIAGVDRREGPVLYFSDPSGTYMKYKAKAIGGGADGAQSMLEEDFHDLLTFREAEDLAFKVLKASMEEGVTESNIEFGKVDAQDGAFRLYSVEEVQAVIDRNAA